MSLNQKIFEEEKKIESMEEKLLDQERGISETINDPKLKLLIKDAQQLDQSGKRLKSKVAKHKIIITIVLSVATTLVGRGIWEITQKIPFLSESIIVLIVGLAILWLLERYLES